MKKSGIYWETKEGKRIKVDDMSVEHLRNVLKGLIKIRIKKERKHITN